MPAFCELQGHRGARGLKPENTLPAFEVAFDLGVTSVETDLHLTRDGIPVLIHNAFLPGQAGSRLIAALSLDEVRAYRVDGNPDRLRFPDQEASLTPLANIFARQQGIDPFTPPTLADLFAFALAYVGQAGESAGKTVEQRNRARQVRFDVELKRVPFRGERIGDEFDGHSPGKLERVVIALIQEAGMTGRTRVRSFDHRSVRAVHMLEPALETAVLIADTAPVSPAGLARTADAAVYCPGVDFLDQSQIRQAHDAGLRVIPWTVNDPEDWIRLVDWGVDGITTDYPDRLAALLHQRGVSWVDG